MIKSQHFHQEVKNVTKNSSYNTSQKNTDIERNEVPFETLKSILYFDSQYNFFDTIFKKNGNQYFRKEKILLHTKYNIMNICT